MSRPTCRRRQLLINTSQQRHVSPQWVSVNIHVSDSQVDVCVCWCLVADVWLCLPSPSHACAHAALRPAEAALNNTCPTCPESVFGFFLLLSVLASSGSCYRTNYIKMAITLRSSITFRMVHELGKSHDIGSPIIVRGPRHV